MNIAIKSPNSYPDIADIKDISKDDLEVNILNGSEIIPLLNNSKFLSDWDLLYNKCPWSTVFQSKKFVLAYYSVTDVKHGAIIAKAEYKKQLVGLLTLTKIEARKLILGAGSGYAEYQTWLCLPAFNEYFIKSAFTKLKDLYPRYKINLYNVPPDTPISWAVEDQHWYKQCILKPLKRPLMDFSNPEVSKIFRKKLFREKLNRLKRIGKVEFEKIIDTNIFNSILDDLLDQSDFRKSAKFNNIEYRLAPYRKEFLLKLHAEGILYTTVLKLNDEVIASIAGAAGRKWVHLSGINTHSPIYSKYSPGLINFIMLGQLLKEEDIQIFDLTPGGDAYKDRLATSFDYVHDLYIASKLKTYIKRNLINPPLKAVKSSLTKRGITPRSIKLKTFKFKSRLIHSLKKDIGLLLSWHYLQTGLTNLTTICKIDLHTPVENNHELIKINNFSEILDYNQNNGFQTKWDLLNDAMQRFESGEQSYTLSENGELLFCAWLFTNSIDKTYMQKLPQNALILDIIFCNEKTNARFKGFISSTISKIREEHNTKNEVYCFMDKRYRSLSQTLKKMD